MNDEVCPVIPRDVTWEHMDMVYEMIFENRGPSAQQSRSS